MVTRLINLIVLVFAGCLALRPPETPPAPEDPALAAVAATADCPGAVVTRLSRGRGGAISVGLLSFEGCGRSETYAYGADGVAFAIDGPIRLSQDDLSADLRVICPHSGGFRDAFWIYASETVTGDAGFPSGWFYPWEVPSDLDGVALATELLRRLPASDIPDEQLDPRLSSPLDDVHLLWLPDNEVMCLRVKAPSGEVILYECVNMAKAAPKPDLSLCGAVPSSRKLAPTAVH